MFFEAHPEWLFVPSPMVMTKVLSGSLGTGLFGSWYYPFGTEVHFMISLEDIIGLEKIGGQKMPDMRCSRRRKTLSYKLSY